MEPLFMLFSRDNITEKEIEPVRKHKRQPSLDSPAKFQSEPQEPRKPSIVLVSITAIILSLVVHQTGRYLFSYGINNFVDTVTGGPVLAKAITNVLFSDYNDYQNSLEIQKAMNDIELIQDTMPIWAKQRTRVYYNSSTDVKFPTADMDKYVFTKPTEDLIMTDQVALMLFITDQSKQPQVHDLMPGILEDSERFAPFIDTDTEEKRFYATWSPKYKQYAVHTAVGIDNDEFVGVISGELLPKAADPDLNFGVDYLYPLIDPETGDRHDMIIYPRRYGNLLRYIRIADEPEEKNVRFVWILKDNIPYMIIVSKRTIKPGERLMV